MVEDDRSPGDTPTWRVTGARRWLLPLLLVLSLAQAVSRLVSLLVEPPPGQDDVIQLVLALLATLVYGWLVVLTVRTRVTLTAEGIEVRPGRTRIIPYAAVTRAYRNRFSRNVVSLELTDGSTVVLPAPVAGHKDAGPALDEAVDLIQARRTSG